jgi:hypothetical protein
MHSSSIAPPREPVRALAVRLLLFSLPLLAAWTMLELRAKSIPNSYSFKRQKLEALANDVDTLVMGSSTAYYGIVPSRLSGHAFNLANNLQTLHYDCELLEQSLPKLPKLRRVLLVIEYSSLYVPYRHRLQPHRQYFYQHEWDIPPASLRDRLDVRMFSRIALSSSNFRAALDGLLGVARYPPVFSDPVDQRGWWCPTNEAMDSARLNVAWAKNTLRSQHQEMNPACEPRNLALLEHLLSLLQRRNIEVVLISMPHWRTYVDAMNRNYWERTTAVIKSLALARNARYLNFLNCPELGAQDFSDVMHLRTAGAIKFTELLNVKLAQADTK